MGEAAPRGARGVCVQVGAALLGGALLPGSACLLLKGCWGVCLGLASVVFNSSSLTSSFVNGDWDGGKLGSL